ncbi:phage tail protein [Niallia nealsonii]|uniref:Phage tail protein n=1 Tax=Niallia nealsonii TaxID=115979 RepID=A0A2N0Z380_9BACI|nr:phage tail protein [Niallia nealsonii]PKG23946.1 phage tail protein [Niallia nealsonii]
MPTTIQEFDAVRISNASIQFFKDGIKQPGIKFGCLGTVEGETEVQEIVKVCEGVTVKRKIKPLRMTVTVSAHIPVAVARTYFGLKDTYGTKVYTYGTDSNGEKFIFTADVIDDFEDVVKLIAFSNCTDNTGLKISIENGADEVALLEVEFTVLPDELKQMYYEAFVDELTDANIASKWHSDFTADLVKGTPTP